MGNIKKYLFEHPVASVFLAWTGADIIRWGFKVINNTIMNRHVERVNEQRIKCGMGYDTLTYNPELNMSDEKDNKDEQTEEGS